MVSQHGSIRAACWFCDRTVGIGTLFQGVTAARICDVCVDFCVQILDGEAVRRDGQLSEPPQRTRPGSARVEESPSRRAERTGDRLERTRSGKIEGIDR